MTDWLTKVHLLHNALEQWLYAAVGALVGYLLVSYLLRLAAKRLENLHVKHLSEAVQSFALAIVQATQRWLVFLFVLFIAASTLHLKAHTLTVIDQSIFVLIGLQLVFWANALIKLWLRHASARTDADAMNPVLLGMTKWVAQFVVWVTFLLAFLANMGINITAFVASLGVGGIAVALALQTILGDLFSSVAIGLDKPFEVGHFIAFRDVLGTVDHVGIKTTRINSLSGEQLVISNSNLLKELIHNYNRMPQRRIVFGFRVPYSTPSAKIQTIVEKTREYINGEENARLDRGHFIAFGEYGFDFEFVYYVLNSDFTLYRDIQQRVNFRIMTLLEELGVKFAVPVRQIHSGAAFGLPESELSKPPTQ